MKDFDLVTKIKDVSSPSIHPTPSASRNTVVKGRDLPPWEGSDGRESVFTRCRQCGFILNTQQTSRGSGYGNEVLTPISGISATKYDPTVGGGCPLCGSSEY